MARFDGKVVFITGAARGQGRSHAARFAAEGADVIAVDICDQIDSVEYPLATYEDLTLTAKEVESQGRRAIIAAADVRDELTLKTVLDQAVEEFGRLDAVVANAGICTLQPWDEVTPARWRDTIDVNLTGTWNTFQAAAPHLIKTGGGSMTAISSIMGIKGGPFLGPYVASKHGIVGIAKSMANELAKHSIRVNTVHPAGVNTTMMDGLGGLPALIARDPELGHIYTNALPVEVYEAEEISNAVLFLASDEARYITGLQMTVDAGCTIR